MEPFYKHNCDCCQFLGKLEAANEKIDFYYCKSQPCGGSLIVRFSSDEPDYAFAPLNVIERIINEQGTKASLWYICYSLWRMQNKG